jgi:hypothetical protein
MILAGIGVGVIFGFLLPRVLSVIGIKDRPQGTTQGILRTGLEGKMPVFGGCTFPLESEFLSPARKPSSELLVFLQ